MTERDLFLSALDQEGPSARSSYLEVACAGQPELRRRIEELLQCHREDDTFLELSALRQLAHDDWLLTFLAPPREAGALCRLDHYEVLKVVGRGSTGVVLKARDTKLQRVVAVKVLAPRLAASGSARERFVREAQAAAAVRDDHVVAIYAVSEDGPVAYLVMEYINGITLEERVKQAGPLELQETLRIGTQLAQGLAAAHAQGLIHRDIKPGNILLEDGLRRAKISDFGLARAAGDAGATDGGFLAGTPLYMSPEQARGEPTDHRSDLFSLGSVLYTLCAGRPPFRANTTAEVLEHVREDAPPPLREINPDVPDWLCNLIAKLHAKKASDRFSSAQEVADLLSPHLALLQQPPGASLLPEVTPERSAAVRSRRRRRVLTLLIGLLLALAALAAVAASGKLRQSQGPHHKPGEATGPASPGPAAPLDLRREDIPPTLLTLAGGGDPARAPPELVAVLGEGRFLLPDTSAGRESDWMAVSADGTMLAVPCGPRVCLFGTRTGTLLRSLTGFQRHVYRAAFSPDGKRLAATPAHYEGGDLGNAVKLWEVESGRELLTLQGHAAVPTAVAFSRDGNRLASGSWDSTVTVWDANTGQAICTLAGHTGAVDSVAFSPDGRRLVSGSYDLTVKVWDLNAAKETHSLSGHTQQVAVLVFSPDGKLLASGSPSEIKLWDANTFEEFATIPASALWMDITPNGTTILAAKHVYTNDEVHTVTKWEVATGKRGDDLRLTSRGGQGVYCLSPDGRTLFAMRKAPMEPYVRAYDAATGKELLPRRGHAAPVHAVAVSPDGRTVASAGEDWAVKLWDLANGQVRHSLSAHTGAVCGLAFSPDGKQLASASRDGTIALWDVDSGTELRALHAHSRSFSRIHFSPDGRTLAAGGPDGLVKLWDVASGKEGSPLGGHTGVVRCVAFNPDGTLLASGGEDKSVRLHDLASGGTRTFKMPGAVNDVAFSPDGRRLAAVTDAPDAAVRLWDLATEAETTWNGHTGHVHGLAFSPSAPLLATCGEDATVRLWDLTGGDPLVRTVGPGPFGGPVRSLAFTPDGRYLTTANANGTVYVLRMGDTLERKRRAEAPTRPRLDQAVPGPDVAGEHRPPAGGEITARPR